MDMKLLGVSVSHLYTVQRLAPINAEVENAYVWMNAYTSCSHGLINTGKEYQTILRGTTDAEQFRTLRERITKHTSTMRAEGQKLHQYEPLAIKALEKLATVRFEDQDNEHTARKSGKDHNQFARAQHIVRQLEGRLHASIQLARLYNIQNCELRTLMDISLPPTFDTTKQYNPEEEKDE
jgi:hypothetical protein